MTGSRRRILVWVIGVTGGLAAAAAILGLVELFGNDGPSGRLAGTGTSQQTARATSNASRGETAASMSLHASPRAVPELEFRDGAGQPVGLTDFRGKVVLLNIWATWCGPCREEMPTLDRLQAELGGPDFEVVALSIDRAGLGVVSEFYDQIGVKRLDKYIDESGEVLRQLGAFGLPTTLLIDRKGREIARHVGPAEWDTSEMVAFFRSQLGRESGALGLDPEVETAHGDAGDPGFAPMPYRPSRLARPSVTTSAIAKGISS